MCCTFQATTFVVLLFTVATCCPMIDSNSATEDKANNHQYLPSEDASIEETHIASPTLPPSFTHKSDDHYSGTSLLPKNPLANEIFYVNPSFQDDVDKSMRTATTLEKKNLATMKTTPSAYWLDVKRKVITDNDSTTDTAEGILKSAASRNPVPLVTFIVYNLPNRDW